MECHHLSCDRKATYYATQWGKHEATGFFCYFHIPSRWDAEPLIGGNRHG